MDDFDWLKDKVKRLAGSKEKYRDICNKSNSKTYNKGLWAFWKLLIHAYYVDIFTNVAKKHKSNVVYIDLLAGPGINYLEDLDLYIAGSPLIAKHAPRITKDGRSKAFDKMVLVDKDQECCLNLEKMLDCKILCADCNSTEVMSEIVSVMKPKQSLSLTFLDPEGTQVHWSTMEKLFRFPGDFIINYPWSGVARFARGYHGTSGKGRKKSGKRLDSFFGDTSWRNVPEDSSAEWLYDFYLNRLEKHKSEVVEFRISMKGGGQYRILIATRKTRGGSPWLDPVRELRDRLDGITDETLTKLVDVYKGKQRPLTDWIS